MAKESPKPPKGDKKTKEEKKEEKRRRKEMKKSKDSLLESEPGTPRRKDTSPGRDSQCSSGKKKTGLFKRIGSFMLPTAALAPASPPAMDKLNTSQSCQDLGGRGDDSGGLASNSISSPNLFNSPPPSSPPPPSPRPHSDSVVSVEYSIPVRSLDTNRQLNFSSDEDVSPRRSSIKTVPSPRKDKRISFAGDDEIDFRVVTPEILKRDLGAALGVPSPPDPCLSPDLLDLPERADLERLPVEQRCREQDELLRTYEEKIHAFRDQVVEIVSENGRLRGLVTDHSSQDMSNLQKQAQLVLQENRTIIKEQQMNEARWQELIEERNAEVLRVRATCSTVEDQNTALLRRTDKLEAKNEELREAYNNIATAADDFVPVAAHLNSVEGYKTALEELRKRYQDTIKDKEDDIQNLEGNISQLTEKLEVLEEGKSLLVGQVKGLRGALARAQQSSSRHKREAVQLTTRVNTLKSSLAQAINIAEQSTLHKMELAEMTGIQEQQKRNRSKENGEIRVKEVKRIANAKLKTCAEILQEREMEHEIYIGKLNERITKLKMRCQTQEEVIQNLTVSDRTQSNSVSPDST